MTSFQSPAHVPESEYRVRRVVALAYRAQRQAGHSHRVAIAMAEEAILQPILRAQLIGWVRPAG
jgi:hypothetical protein